MLKLNGNIVEIYKFPDGTPRMALDVENLEKHEKNEIGRASCRERV